ncbi:UNVERIFIED_CONTAM: hypothetical protein LK11_38335 [Mumia flava]
MGLGQEALMAETYYYCVKHHQVEGADGCKAIDRLGPYDTREEAERALEIAQERNEAWDSEDDD